MAKLILSMDGLVLKEIPLVKPRTTIGRKPHNDIQIDNLAISGEHAVITMVINDAFLEDLHSTNGTFVNGAPIRRHLLQDGDVIELGKYRLKYLSELPAAAVADFEKTVLLRPGMIQPPGTEPRAGDMPDPRSPGDTAEPAGVSPRLSFEDVSTSPRASVPAAPRAMIQILTGSHAGRELELSKPLTSIGKPGVQVAVIARRPQGYFMTHLEGEVPPSVGGQRLEPDRPFELHDHDIIEFGGIKMEFFYKT